MSLPLFILVYKNVVNALFPGIVTGIISKLLRLWMVVFELYDNITMIVI